MSTTKKTRKPKTTPVTPFPADSEKLHEQGNWLWIPLRNEWRTISAKPEEVVRQHFIRHLCKNLGYTLPQMDQERRTQYGRKSPRADIVLWETPEAKAANKTPVLVIECKAENVNINIKDYYQGESYARAMGCEFFVAHNNRYTAVFKLVPGAPGEFVQINEIPKASDWGNAKRIEEIKSRLRSFNRREFQDLLFACHSILRDVHKMDPGRAFDTISKILFIRMYVERSGLHGTFTVDFLDRREATRMPNESPVHDRLFDQTKDYYHSDDLFAETDRLEISEATFRRIVKKLERFDLSKTGDDIKGLAFEKFLGTTFRGKLGQYFTPRPIVEFMVNLLNPQEGELVCDPAAGSGGFLIRAFEHVREQIATDIQKQKDEARTKIEAKKLKLDKEEELIAEAFARLNQALLPSNIDNKSTDTRVGRLAWNCIFGCDAEPRAARTAKMNMIMHGDGHGGIHYHDGLVDINGVFPERFDIVMTNPPFGSNVGSDQKVGGSEETRVPEDAAYQNRCQERYGDVWAQSHQRMIDRAKTGTNILDLFEIGAGKANRATEIIFVERCLKLLKPGGRMGIVLPDGNLNNPSLAWLRRWCEGRARILAIVSLPEETFRSADATVKASQVFLRRFTEADEAEWETAWAEAHARHDAAFDTKRNDLCVDLGQRIVTGENENVAAILADLAELGVERTRPGWKPGKPPAYPRGVGPSQPITPRWQGTATDKKRAGQLKKDYAAAFDGATTARSNDLFRELRAGLRSIDEAHNAALWASVRETFDYPVFVAAPKAVGITSTGETGETIQNDLPQLLNAYRAFEDWVEKGTKPEDAPDFPLPSTA